MTAGLCVSLGDVLYLRCTLCNEPAQKFFVVAQVQPLRMFLINSELTEFAKARPAHVAASPLIRYAEHSGFLKYDSFVGCDHLSHEYSYERVEALLSANPSIRVGQLHPNAKAAIGSALRGNFLLPRKYLKDLLPLWP